ncbi:hypothetical protein [Pseudomonas sp. nanlin1]|uniref:hypothetical protein n=1 Tax=Pseudomonas sp. nanlin1 TaxID=3040605 RepID=UPI00388FE1C1
MKAQLLDSQDLQDYLELQQLLPLLAPLDTLLTFIHSRTSAAPQLPVDLAAMEAPIRALLAQRVETVSNYQRQVKVLQGQTKTVQGIIVEAQRSLQSDSDPWTMGDEAMGALKGTSFYFSIVRDDLQTLRARQHTHTQEAIHTLAPIKRQLTQWADADKGPPTGGKALDLGAILPPSSPFYLFIDRFLADGIYDCEDAERLARFSLAAETMFERNIEVEDRIEHSLAVLGEYYEEIETQCVLMQNATRLFAAQLAAEHIQRLCKELDTLLSDFALIPIPTVN